MPRMKTSKKQTEPTREALVFHAMYLMSVIDGEASSPEFQVVKALLTTLPGFARSPISDLVKASKKLVAEHGGVVESLAALTSIKDAACRRKCYLLCAEVAYASGDISKVEAHLLASMARLLKLKPAETKAILKTLAIKYAD